MQSALTPPSPRQSNARRLWPGQFISAPDYRGIRITWPRWKTWWKSFAPCGALTLSGSLLLRKSGSRILKPAISLGLSLALLQASRISGAGAQWVSLATEAAVQEGMLPADVSRTMFLPGWHLAQQSDFDSDAATWLRSQGATPSSTMPADFSAKDNGRDVAYILANEQGVMTLVISVKDNWSTTSNMNEFSRLRGYAPQTRRGSGGGILCRANPMVMACSS